MDKRDHQSSQKKRSDVELLNRLLAKSELSDADAEEIGHKIKREIWKRFA